MLVPGVGVREGILLDLVAQQYSGGIVSDEERGRAAEIRQGALWFASRLNYNQHHAEQVARLALSLFDQLRPIHEMGSELRLLLEVAALLHDIGHFVNRKNHNRHGEYLIRNGEVPGLRGWRCEMVAALVRYHNSKSEPALEHSSYAALDGERRRQCRLLTSLLRIAEKLDPAKTYRSYVKMQPVTGSKGVVAGDVYVFNSEDRVIGVVGGLKFQRLPRTVLSTFMKQPGKAAAPARAAATARSPCRSPPQAPLRARRRSQPRCCAPGSGACS